MNSLRVTSAAALSATLVVAASPAFAHHPISADQVAQFKVGVATYEQVVATLGKPSSVTIDSDGIRIVTYSSIRTHPKAITFVPVVGLFAGGATGDISWAIFTFGQDGRLTRSTMTDANTDCTMRLVSMACEGSGMTPLAQSAEPVAARVPTAPVPSVEGPAKETPLATTTKTQSPSRPHTGARSHSRPCLRVLTDPAQSSC
jgi:hypothetical protein